MSATAEPPLLRQSHGDVVVLSLNRPRQRNSLVWETWSAFEVALDDFAEAPDVAAIVLTGTGEFFSSGGDLKTGPAHGVGALAAAARVEHAQGVLRRLRSLPVPVIAAIEGGAVGLGWSLALACDMVVAAHDSFFSAPFVARGVVPDGGIAWFLSQRIGRHRATQLLLTGERLPAPVAHSLGLVNLTTEPGQALEGALALARDLAANDRRAVELTMRLLAHCERSTLDDYQTMELAMAAVAQHRKDPPPTVAASPSPRPPATGRIS
jgi:enoyl-CoA hydratase/carnithine racemase